MGNCIYCGKPAGLLSTKHKECEAEFQRKKKLTEKGVFEITNRICRFIVDDNQDVGRLENFINETAKGYLVSSSDKNTCYLIGWEAAIDKFLDDGVLDEVEEQKLSSFQEKYLEASEVDTHGYFTKIVKAAAIRDLLSGIVPQRISFNEQLPINFQKEEQVVWLFPDTKYFEDKVFRKYVGRTAGLSVRVMKGVYLRSGAFKGMPVDNVERTLVGQGLFVVTDKNLYFVCSAKSIRVPFSKIVSFEPYQDGVGIMKDNATAKPQTFVTGDGWFTYNLVSNLAQM